MNQPAKTNKKNNNQGYSLIEVLLAISIFSIGILGVAALQISSTGSTSTASKITDATYYAEDKLEELISFDWADPDLDPAGNMHTEATADGYTIQWDVTDADLDANGTNDSKIIDLTVSHNVFNVGTTSLLYVIAQPE
jgi:prepilin-type N-terminal cleavage/methylation domain-containing protein